MRGNYLFTSESVSEGHPDKVCDRISDAVVDAFLGSDPMAKVACETLVTTNTIVVAGEVRMAKDKASPKAIMSKSGKVNKKLVESLARKAVKEIGYAQKGFHWKKAEVHGAPARPVRRHRAGRRRGRQQGRGRGRPRHHVRLRDERDAGADAGATPVFAQYPEVDGRRATLRQAAAARAGREEPGHAAVRRRQAGARDRDRRVDAAQGKGRQARARVGRHQRDRPSVREERAAGRMDAAGGALLCESDGPLRHRRTGRRQRAHRAQDHRRHLRRCSPAWRRRVLRQGPLEGRPLGCLRRALPREERGRRRPRRPLHDPALLRDRRRASAVGLCEHGRHRKGGRAEAFDRCCRIS